MTQAFIDHNHYYSKTAYTQQTTTVSDLRYLTLFRRNLEQHFQSDDDYPQPPFPYAGTLFQNYIFAWKKSQNAIFSLIGYSLTLLAVYGLPLLLLTDIVSLLLQPAEAWPNTMHYATMVGCFFAYQLERYYQQHQTADNLAFIIFNRKTGMVVLPAEPESPFDVVLPFAECQPYYTLFPSRQVHYRYALHLHHPDSGYQDLLGQYRSLEEVQLMWEFLQHYMNISQPLPDLPAFEASRHLDPISAYYDRQQRRSPRYWRDMTAQQFTEIYQSSAATFP